MKSPTIGIKLADGSFCPIMEENSNHKKKLILTAAKAEQPNVRIDLFRGFGQEMDGAQKVGSLSVENDPEGPSKDIEFILHIDEQGQLTAFAGLVGSDEKQTLSLSLEDYQDQVWTGEEDSQDPMEEEVRSDLDILADDSLLDGEELGDMDSFTMEELDDEPKTDQEILDDDSLAEEGLDEFIMDDLTLDEEISPKVVQPDEDLILNDDFSLDDLDSTADESLATTEATEVSLDDDLESMNLDGTDDFNLDEETESSDSSDSLESMDFDSSDDFDLSDMNLDDDSSVDSRLDLDSPVGDLPGLDDLDLSSMGDEAYEPEVSAAPEQKTTPAPVDLERGKPKAAVALGIPKVNKFPMIFSMVTLGLLITSILFLLVFNMLKTSAVPPIKLSYQTQVELKLESLAELGAKDQRSLRVL